MRRFKLCGIGNALVDVLVEVTEAEFSGFDLERSSMRLVEHAEQQRFLEALKHKTPKLVSGGSVGNSLIAFAQLGGAGAFITSLGDDRYGLFYKAEAEELGLELGAQLKYQRTTGTCVALITPDAERTMRTCLAAAAELEPADVDESVIRDSEWLFIEGYLFANPPSGIAAVGEAIECARRAGTKIALTVSEDFIATVFGEKLKVALTQADLLFANEREAIALTGKKDGAAAFKELKSRHPAVVVTRGAQGALVSFGGAHFSVPAFACEPIDLLGAGDMFAGSFLYGITHGFPPEIATQGACYLAMQVITRRGARIQTGVREFWQSATKGE